MYLMNNSVYVGVISLIFLFSSFVYILQIDNMMINSVGALKF